MQCFFMSVGYLAMVAIPVGLVVRLFYDLNHPELWADWKENPHIYLLFLAVAVIPVLLYAMLVFGNWYRAMKQYERILCQRNARDENGV